MLPQMDNNRSLWFQPFDMMNRELARVQDVLPGWMPSAPENAADVEEDDEAFLVTMDLPGFRRQDVDVCVTGGVLSIQAERRRPETDGRSGDDRPRRHLSERRFARVERSFPLPGSVDPEGIAAHLEEGVLVIELPKKEKAAPRRIQLS